MKDLHYQDGEDRMKPGVDGQTFKLKVDKDWLTKGPFDEDIENMAELKKALEKDKHFLEFVTSGRYSDVPLKMILEEFAKHKL